jgi:hypothetical protein
MGVWGTYENQNDDFLNILYNVLDHYNVSELNELSVQQLGELFSSLDPYVQVGVMNLIDYEPTEEQKTAMLDYLEDEIDRVETWRSSDRRLQSIHNQMALIQGVLENRPTRLIRAIQNRDDEKVEILQEDLETINIQEYMNGNTALIIATATSAYYLIPELLALGADPNIVNDENMSALVSITDMMYQTESWELLEYVKLLLMYGADPNIGRSEDDNLSFYQILPEEYVAEITQLFLDIEAEQNLLLGDIVLRDTRMVDPALIRYLRTYYRR